MRRIPGLSGNLLPIHPKVLPDELLTSWLLRTAHANGMKLQRLLDSTLGRGTPTLNRDYDRWASPSHLRRFSSITGEHIDRLEAATLRCFDGTFIKKIRTDGGTSRWILAQGIYHRMRKRHGLQYCPMCLSMDSIPYFRTHWCCAFYLECYEHQIQLLDSCPSCDAPVVPFRIDTGKRLSTLASGLIACHKCGCDLRHGRCTRIDYPTWELAVNFRNLTGLHWWSHSLLFDAGTASAVDVFNDWWQFTSIVLKQNGPLRPREKEVSQLVGMAEQFKKKGRCGLQEMRTKDRIAPILLGLWIMLDWPHHFNNALYSAKATPRSVWSRYPNWFRTSG